MPSHASWPVECSTDDAAHLNGRIGTGRGGPRGGGRREARRLRPRFLEAVWSAGPTASRRWVPGTSRACARSTARGSARSRPRVRLVGSASCWRRRSSPGDADRPDARGSLYGPVVQDGSPLVTLLTPLDGARQAAPVEITATASESASWTLFLEDAVLASGTGARGWCGKGEVSRPAMRGVDVGGSRPDPDHSEPRYCYTVTVGSASRSWCATPTVGWISSVTTAGSWSRRLRSSLPPSWSRSAPIPGHLRRRRAGDRDRPGVRRRGVRHVDDLEHRLFAGEPHAADRRDRVVELRR
jgi:hypothetical protein